MKKLKGNMANAPSTGCFNCKHLIRQRESWEMPHVWWFECKARGAKVENLKGWPWANTSCQSLEGR